MGDLRRFLPAALAVAVLAVGLAPAAGADGGRLVYSGSLQVASGDYLFDERTTGVYLVQGLAWEQGPWTIGADVPVIYQDTPFVAFVGGRPVPTGGPRAGEVDRRRGRRQVPVGDPRGLDFDEIGLGDPVLRLGYRLHESASGGESVELRGMVKPAVADSTSGFGTGEWDVGAAASWTWRAWGGLLLADVDVWKLGDPPDIDLDDPIGVAVSWGRPLAGGPYSVLGGVTASTGVVPEADSPVELHLTLLRSLEGRRSVAFTLSAGLTESVPDVSFTTGWRVGGT